MIKFTTTVRATLLAGVVLIALAACQKQEGPAERAGKEVDQAAQKVGQQIEKAGESLQEASKGDKKVKCPRQVLRRSPAPQTGVENENQEQVTEQIRRRFGARRGRRLKPSSFTASGCGAKKDPRSRERLRRSPKATTSTNNRLPKRRVSTPNR